MPKWMFIWNPPRGTPLQGFAEDAREQVSEKVRGLGAQELGLHVTAEPPPRAGVIPFKRRPLAVVSVRGEDVALGALAGDRLDDLPGAWAGYRVEEAVPVARTRTWGIGERAPGACLLTIFRRHPRLDREAFLQEWHGKHTPMSLEIHPLWSYVRNTVTEILLPGSPPWDGLVTESFREPGELLNPLRLFGGPLKAPLNMARVGMHISRFMDLRGMENFLVGEWDLEP
ncbi:MAG TPA: hypothetical protein PK668_02320 [Myxococcota bacterium]|nr:hypothetical protein [Myxococcota bacterium]HRY94596.1 hypothetical protein [Myxococcota bacterium]HSA20322.1 hypothetical protein [Myxococcota bacterium]